MSSDQSSKAFPTRTIFSSYPSNLRHVPLHTSFAIFAIFCFFLLRFSFCFCCVCFCLFWPVCTGKTTLLDALRNDAFKSLAAAASLVAPAPPSGRAAKKAAGKKAQANRGQGPSGSALVSEEAASEAGGITQRVAAFHVTTRFPSARKGPFLVSFVSFPRKHHCYRYSGD